MSALRYDVRFCLHTAQGLLVNLQCPIAELLHRIAVQASKAQFLWPPSSNCLPRLHFFCVMKNMHALCMQAAVSIQLSGLYPKYRITKYIIDRSQLSIQRFGFLGGRRLRCTASNLQIVKCLLYRCEAFCAYFQKPGFRFSRLERLHGGCCAFYYHDSILDYCPLPRYRRSIIKQLRYVHTFENDDIQKNPGSEIWPANSLYSDETADGRTCMYYLLITLHCMYIYYGLHPQHVLSAMRTRLRSPHHPL